MVKSPTNPTKQHRMPEWLSSTLLIVAVVVAALLGITVVLPWGGPLLTHLAGGSLALLVTVVFALAASTVPLVVLAFAVAQRFGRFWYVLLAAPALIATMFLGTMPGRYGTSRGIEERVADSTGSSHPGVFMFAAIGIFLVMLPAVGLYESRRLRRQSDRTRRLAAVGCYLATWVVYGVIVFWLGR